MLLGLLYKFSYCSLLFNSISEAFSSKSVKAHTPQHKCAIASLQILTSNIKMLFTQNSLQIFYAKMLIGRWQRRWHRQQRRRRQKKKYIYWCYYPHRSRDSLSPVSGIFCCTSAKKLLWSNNNKLLICCGCTWFILVVLLIGQMPDQFVQFIIWA